jgi:hypothetical protein
MQPNFLVIGAMKCATTTVCDILRQHPQAFVSSPKELDFFSHQSVFDRGWDWYQSNFKAANGKRAVGEGSTSYTKQSLFPDTAERVARSLPDARLVYIVRHPLRRIESHLLHIASESKKATDINVAIAKWPEMIDISLYWKQISAYRRHYPDDRIHVIFLEELEKSPAAAIARCCAFLGIDPPVAAAHLHSNASEPYVLNERVADLINAAPALQKMINVQPAFLKRLAKTMLKPVEPRWSDQALAAVARQLEDDTAEFLSFYGKPKDYWPLTPLPAAVT